MFKVQDFQEFLHLNESNGSGANIIIGDSQTPFIAKRSQNVKMISKVGSKSSLWLGGMGLGWLKDAVREYPTSPNVSNVVICIGTNGGFNIREDIQGLFSQLKRAFPKANFYAVQGSWGWGGNRSITTDRVKTYYDKFAQQGATIIEPPIGKVNDPHGNLPVYAQIGKAIDSYIKTGSTFIPAPAIQTTSSEVQQKQDDEESPKDIEGFQDWLDENKPGWAWGYTGGVVNKSPGYGRFGPRTTKAWKSYGEEYLKTQRIQSYTNIKSSFSGKDPEKVDPIISKDFNFHIIPDGKGTNYRSAQFTPDVMKKMYEKYGIKNVIRFNGDGKDSIHRKGNIPVSIKQEEDICKEIGCNFYKLSSTRDQEKVNKILSEGNTLVHCAHGADRTGGNVGGYLYKTKRNPELTTPESIWEYTTKYNGWNRMVKTSPEQFKNGYLQQAQKFGVRDFLHALELAKK
jgi:hypothetical protein